MGAAFFRHDAQKLALAPNDDAPRRPCVFAARGSPVWAGGLLQDLYIERLLGHQLLQAGILFLQSPQLLGHLRRHPAILLALAIVRLLRDLERFTDLGHLLTLAQSYIRLTQFLDDLVRRMSRLLHLKRMLSGLRPDAILPSRMDQFQGGRPRSPTTAARWNRTRYLTLPFRRSTNPRPPVPSDELYQAGIRLLYRQARRRSSERELIVVTAPYLIRAHTFTVLS